MGFGKDGKGAILREATNITLSTLGAVTAIKAGTQLVLEDDFRVIKTEVSGALDGAAADETPILLGLADNELSVAEIGEAMNLNGPVDRNDRVAVERAERPVWVVGSYDSVFNRVAANAGGAPLEKVLRWTFSNPEGWTWFAFNRTAATLTTGAVFRLEAKYFGVWVT